MSSNQKLHNSVFEGKKIIFIGDSHASFFSGYNLIQPIYPEKAINKFSQFEGVRLGAVLAYSLNKVNTTNRGRENFFEVLDMLNLSDHIIGLCFGEIDCRYHIVKQAKNKNISIEDAVNECFNSYSALIDEVAKIGYKIVLWNVIPTSPLTLNNPEFPHFGSDEERQIATEYFNTLLLAKANDSNVFFLSIYNHLIKYNRRKRHFFFDGVHLSQAAMYFTCRELNRINKASFIKNISSIRRSSLKIIIGYYYDDINNRIKLGLIKLLKRGLKIRN